MMSLPYLGHGVVLSLAWFLALNVVVCGLVVAAGALLTRGERPRPAALWIALRLLPAVAASSFVLFLFVPSYWKYEPREFVEGFDLTLSLTALTAFLVIAAAVVRGIVAWRSAARRTREWMRRARRLTIDDVALPAFAIDVDQPIIALVGVLRPRLLITNGLIEALTEPELKAAVRHELGHLRAFDNLKRLLMRAAPDVLAGSAVTRALERRWASAAEHLADRVGGSEDPAARCALASALVKVARLTPPMVPAAEPISSLIAGGDIASRVRTLLADGHAAEPRFGGTRIIAAAAVAAAFATAYGPLLRTVHELTELVVRLTP